MEAPERLRQRLAMIRAVALNAKDDARLAAAVASERGLKVGYLEVSDLLEAIRQTAEMGVPAAVEQEWLRRERRLPEREADADDPPYETVWGAVDC